ncbi:ABC transporter ATP-binding protein [Methylobacterium pseudosasicola]
MDRSPLLDVDALSVAYGGVPVVDGVSFRLASNERLGIVGESGSGKSQTARAVLGLLATHARVEATRLSFEGRDLLGMGPRARRQLRGRRIAMVMQDPQASLNTVMRIGAQIDEVHRRHRGSSAAEARARTLEALEGLGLDDAGRVYRAYPHEVSGGMAQRAMIAMMLAPDPSLLIADEPTSALDMAVAAGVMETLREQVERRRMAMVVISHDLDLVASFCDRVLVMWRGRIVEACGADRLHEARHPYTRGLLGCIPRLGRRPRRLATIDRGTAHGD